MKRTEITYGQLDSLLRSLGFTCRLVTHNPPPARVYELKGSEAIIIMPAFALTDFVLDYHLVGARTIVDQFGIADPKVFDAKLEKVAG
jgi:hypothetical protein